MECIIQMDIVVAQYGSSLVILLSLNSDERM